MAKMHLKNKILILIQWIQLEIIPQRKRNKTNVFHVDLQEIFERNYVIGETIS